jgi:iron-sulfur cluster assembly accessory protein
VRRLLEERNLHEHALRVFVSGGGCSGMQYGMALEGNPRESDQRFAFEGVDVIVDPMSMTYLAGCTIDYVEDVMGGGFHRNRMLSPPAAVVTVFAPPARYPRGGQRRRLRRHWRSIRDLRAQVARRPALYMATSSPTSSRDEADALSDPESPSGDDAVRARLLNCSQRWSVLQR